MKGLAWKLPVLRDFSPMCRGILESGAVTLSGALAFAYSSSGLISPPSEHFLENVAEIGATLLVADAVQIGWFLQNSRKRGADRENWVGIMAGLSACALIGITISLLLADHRGSFTWFEQIGFGWVVVSLFLLGLLVAFQPLNTYEWAHSLNTEYSDDE
jgi:hypothetical protein